MSYGLRSIAFVAELIHPPVKHNAQQLQKLHGSLFGQSDCSYKDFRIVAGGAQLSNSTGGMPGSPVSSASFVADRIQIREEQTGISREEFTVRLESLARTALSELPMQMFMAQQFAVRSVVNPQSEADARQFLLKSVFGFPEGSLAPFGSEPSLAGLRLAFPPQDPGGGIFNVRLESFTMDNRSLFLENVGTFGSPVNVEGVGTLVERFESTYDFLQDQLLGFVSGFDDAE